MKQHYGIEFLPLVVDCFGAWDSRALAFLKKISGSIAKLRRKSYAETTLSLYEGLEPVTVDKGIARTFFEKYLS